MPWCENSKCGKTGLKKSEVIFDENNQKILCVPCGQAASVTDQALMGEVVDKTWFGIGFSSDEGIRAELIHGGAKLSLKLSNDQVMKFLGT